MYQLVVHLPEAPCRSSSFTLVTASDTFPAPLASGDTGLVPPLPVDPGESSRSEEEGRGRGRSLEATQPGLGLTEDRVCWLLFRKDELLEP